MTLSVRRIVAAVTADGRSIIESDERLEPNVPAGPSGRGAIIRLWSAAATPPDLSAADRPLRMRPGATNFAVFQIPPEGENPPATAEASGGPHPDSVITHGGLYHTTTSDPTYHRTDSLDYVVVASGEVWFTVGTEEVHLKAGDCVVQRGNWHAWRNRGSVPCTLIGCMIGAEPTDQQDGE